MITALLGLGGLLLVMIGAGIGTVGRWALAEHGPRLLARRLPEVDLAVVRPWMTWTANVVSSFLLGIVVTRLGAATGGAGYVFLLLGTGLCGGLSVLSRAAMDVVDLVRRGTASIALGYLMLSVGVSMAFLWLGLVIGS